MIRNKGKINTVDGVLFCFLASVIIAVFALNIGLVTEPGKILPTGLSMRSGETDTKIIRGIEIALDDINRIRSGNATDLWRLLTFVHMDLFFYLALILPKAVSKTILLAGYYVRFGLCCSSMFYFLSGHLKLRRLGSALLSVMYTFSSQIIFSAQFASVMNMAIMLPLVMSAFDSYMQKRTWKSFTFVCIASFGLSVTGGFGVITGIPAVILISLLMSISLYSTFRMAFTSWLKLLGGIVTGLLCSMLFVIPGFFSMNFDLNALQSFENAKVNYTVFDLLRGSFMLRSGSMYVSNIPLFYIGILTFVSVILFALNETVPVRIKIASAVIAAVFHISCASSFINEMLSVFGTAPLINTSRLICLEIVLFFTAGLGVKNLKTLKRGEFIAAGLIPLAFLVISNNSSLGTTLASPIIITTFLAMIVEPLIVYAIAKDRLNAKAKASVLVFVFIMVGVNTAFVFFNNTVQNQAASEYFTDDKEDDASDILIMDNSFDIPAINDSDSYLLIPADLSRYETGERFIGGINYLSDNASDEVLFEKVYLTVSDIGDFEQDGLDEFMIREGSNSLSFEPVQITGDERMFVYCSYSDGASLKIRTGSSEAERVYTGPFLTELNAEVEPVTLEFNIEADVTESCHISLYKLNEKALNVLDSMSGEIDGSSFLIDLKNPAGVYTLVLPYAYDSDTGIHINGVDTGSFSFCGKTAVTFISDGSNVMEISIKRRSTGIVPGAVLSAVSVSCLIVIPVIHMYNKKKKNVSAEGNVVNA